jgi:hypothetical protein
VTRSPSTTQRQLGSDHQASLEIFNDYDTATSRSMASRRSSRRRSAALATRSASRGCGDGAVGFLLGDLLGKELNAARIH